MFSRYEFNASCVMACASIVGHKTQQWLGCEEHRQGQKENTEQWLGCGGRPARAKAVKANSILNQPKKCSGMLILPDLTVMELCI